MLTQDDGVLEVITPAVQEEPVAPDTLPYLVATVMAPSSPVGEFTYALDLNYGNGWAETSNLNRVPVRLTSGAQKRIPVYGLRGPVGYRLRTLSWEARPEQLRGKDPSVLQPLLDCEIPAVREAALLCVAHL